MVWHRDDANELDANLRSKNREIKEHLETIRRMSAQITALEENAERSARSGQRTEAEVDDLRTELRAAEVTLTGETAEQQLEEYINKYETVQEESKEPKANLGNACLLYTSDAADE